MTRTRLLALSQVILVRETDPWDSRCIGSFLRPNLGSPCRCWVSADGGTIQGSSRSGGSFALVRTRLVRQGSSWFLSTEYTNRTAKVICSVHPKCPVVLVNGVRELSSFQMRWPLTHFLSVTSRKTVVLWCCADDAVEAGSSGSWAWTIEVRLVEGGLGEWRGGCVPQTIEESA